MRQVGLVALTLLLFTWGGAVAAPVAEEAPRVGYKAPRFSAPSLDGAQVSLGAMQGRVVLLNFWATWCAPCKEELPSLVALQSSFPVTDFTVVALSQDADPKDVAKFLKKHPINFPNGVDEDASIGRAYQVRGLPATYLIDTRGVIVERIFGPRDYDTKEWRQKIEKLIGQGKAAPQPSKP
jgi:methylamine dehydrogenase accessory protein MauD